MLLWRDCLCPRDVTTVGSNQLCGMGVMRQNDENWQWLIQRNQVQWTRFLCRENRVLWTRFLPTFFVREPLSSCRNRALFTRIAKNQNSLKCFITNDIVWVLLLFSKKNQNFMAYFLAFGLFCFHVAFIHIKTGENWRITNGRGARPYISLGFINSKTLQNQKGGGGGLLTVFWRLKFIELNRSQKLIETPDFSEA